MADNDPDTPKLSDAPALSFKEVRQLCVGSEHVASMAAWCPTALARAAQQERNSHSQNAQSASTLPPLDDVRAMIGEGKDQAPAESQPAQMPTPAQLRAWFPHDFSPPPTQSENASIQGPGAGAQAMNAAMQTYVVVGLAFFVVATVLLFLSAIAKLRGGAGLFGILWVFPLAIIASVFVGAFFGLLWPFAALLVPAVLIGARTNSTGSRKGSLNPQHFTHQLEPGGE